MYYYVRLLKNTPMEAVIGEPFKIVFTITTDLTEATYQKPCKLHCHAVVRTKKALQSTGAEENDKDGDSAMAAVAATTATIITQGLAQGASLMYDPSTGFCTADIRFAPCMTAYEECQLVLSLDRSAFQPQVSRGAAAGGRRVATGPAMEPPEYEILPAWSLPIQLVPPPLNQQQKHRKVNKKYLIDTRQDLVERYFRLPPHLEICQRMEAIAGPGARSLLIREDATEGFMARHIWDSGVFMARYLMQPDSWLSRYMQEEKEKEKKKEKEEEAKNKQDDDDAQGSNKTEKKARKCLELGAGTGLVGIAVAVAFPELEVESTDLEEALQLMQQNVDDNGAFLLRKNMKVGFLDWAETDRQGVEPVEVLLLADVVYNEISHGILLQTILDYSDAHTKVLLGYKFRHEAEAQFFEEAKKHFDMQVVHQQDTMQLFVLTRKEQK
ncbi:hypothetical protein DFQ27_003366 [Actinomortierella ambigua]|uniref:Uncharacterized protein n=1 Tax=Actinomortierella ambigua TaxID=1343610 RepID=A0A9P6QKG6_9FUNG|nr:hypothetical protein DFQ27_003366 [Actinomortierella ambigua]